MPQNLKQVPEALTWNEIERFAYRQGLNPKLVKRFLTEIGNNLEYNGPEWTVGRVKSIRNCLRAYYASSFDKRSLATNQVKKTQAGNFAGLFGEIQRLCHNLNDFVKVMNLLQIASAFLAEEPTKTQIRKFKDAVLTERSLETPREYTELMVEVSRRLELPSFPKGTDVLTSPRNKESHDNRLLEEWMMWSRSSEGLKVITKCDWFTPFITGDENLLSMMGFRSCTYDVDTVGNIYSSQEPGFKLRCFAAPMMWTQVCLEPLKKYLMSLLKSLPWDLTHAQEFADGKIQEYMRLGGMVHCYDLSNASDLIPWDSQEAILRQIVPFSKTQYVELFKYVARGRWKFEPTNEIISWHRGQPLGSGPSFGSFALWHGLLLTTLNGGEHNDKFFIVGDDVVILDDTLARFYEQALEDISLDWSPLKTMHSNRVAEFTGRLITPQGVYKSPKWKKFTSENFVDNLFNLGHRFFDFIPKKHREVLEAVASLPEPWGIGYNPKGLSLTARLNNAEYLLVPDKEEIEHDLLPSRRALDRISALSDRENSRFYPVASSRRFWDSLKDFDAKAHAEALAELGEDSEFLFADNSNLNGLLLERFSNKDQFFSNGDKNTHKERSSLPVSRRQKKLDKQKLERAFASLNSLAKRFKPLIELPITEDIPTSSDDLKIVQFPLTR